MRRKQKWRYLLLCRTIQRSECCCPGLTRRCALAECAFGLVDIDNSWKFFLLPGSRNAMPNLSHRFSKLFLYVCAEVELNRRSILETACLGTKNPAIVSIVWRHSLERVACT